MIYRIIISQFLLLKICSFYCLPSSLAGEDFIKGLQSPGKQWGQNYKNSGTEVEFFLKKNKDLLNISARLFKNIPFTAQTFLTEVRKQMQGDSRYRGATLTAIRKQTFGGREWETFTVIADPELHQELWSRKLNQETVLVVLYTAVGNYYTDYRSAFDHVLRQTAL